MEQTPRKLISVITPCYNEEDNVLDCGRAVREVFDRHLPAYDYEHIFCDNASTDRTVPLLKQLAAEDRRVRLIVNARNFGPLRSVFNALLASSGDAVVVLLAADLQDPPELIVEFVRQWEQGHEIVYGVRASREENVVMRLIRKCYYRLVRSLAHIQVPANVGSFQLIDRVVVNALRQFDDYYPYIPGMIASCGFRSVGVPYVWKARRKGVAKNRLWHLTDEALNSLISFTRIPMRLCMFIGIVIAALSLLRAGYTVVMTLITDGVLTQPGIPTLLVAVFFFAGVQLFTLGVLGEYISAIHLQVRKRPLVVERERVNFETAPDHKCVPTVSRFQPEKPEFESPAPVTTGAT